MTPDFFYSDPHFGHDNIISFSNRPFKDVPDMTEGLIARYNEAVKPEHTVLWCGDASMKIKPEEMADILVRLNGTKILVRGNHDGSIGRCHRMGFGLVMEEAFLFIRGKTCRVSHYPYAWTEAQKAAWKAKGNYVDDRYLEKRPPRVKGEVLIHGHTHHTTRVDGNQIHVGVDAWDYRPVPVERVAQLVARVGGAYTVSKEDRDLIY